MSAWKTTSVLAFCSVCLWETMFIPPVTSSIMTMSRCCGYLIPPSLSITRLQSHPNLFTPALCTFLHWLMSHCISTSALLRTSKSVTQRSRGCSLPSSLSFFFNTHSILEMESCNDSHICWARCWLAFASPMLLLASLVCDTCPLAFSLLYFQFSLFLSTA